MTFITLYSVSPKESFAQNVPSLNTGLPTSQIPTIWLSLPYQTNSSNNGFDASPVTQALLFSPYWKVSR